MVRFNLHMLCLVSFLSSFSNVSPGHIFLAWIHSSAFGIINWQKRQMILKRNYYLMHSCKELCLCCSNSRNKAIIEDQMQNLLCLCGLSFAFGSASPDSKILYKHTFFFHYHMKYHIEDNVLSVQIFTFRVFILAVT